MSRRPHQAFAVLESVNVRDATSLTRLFLLRVVHLTIDPISIFAAFDLLLVDFDGTE